MLPSIRSGTQCIRCAYRLRLLSLQQTRSHSAIPLKKYLRRREDSRTQRREHVQDRPDRHDQPRIWNSSRSEAFFRAALVRRIPAIKAELRSSDIVAKLLENGEKPSGKHAGTKSTSFADTWDSFAISLPELVEKRDGTVIPRGANPEIMDDLRHSFVDRGVNGLDSRLKYLFYGHIVSTGFSASDIKNQKTMADLRYPNEWYPATRSMQRTIHLHVGPTNSGKTYNALKRLEAAESGVYGGPLRLLAHEVYSRMNAKGIPCSLITGEERRLAEDTSESTGHLQACTVEMMPLNRTLDVAVIDEIQMIGNTERGWAWTQALLGVKAKEVHLCGEERTVPLIQEICASIGEKLQIHRYERLSPLSMAPKSLHSDMQQLRKGDCIVCFSVVGIHAMRRQIEQDTGRKVAIVYGSLPPETRAQQARLFNDPDNDYDFLVASDAVGMGLNLAIRRVIFETSHKFDGQNRRTLSVADIKQIAGRAGRFRTAAQATLPSVSAQDLAQPSTLDIDPQPTPTIPLPDENNGLVTTLEQFDFPIIQAAMKSDPEPIVSAGLFPPASILERFATYFPAGTPFSFILTRLHELSLMHKRFHLCGLRDTVWIADLIEFIPNLTVTDRLSICAAPASRTDSNLWQKLMPAYARCIAEQTGGDISEIAELPLEILESDLSFSREYLRALEQLHKGIVTYLWLSYRFAGIFNTRALAFHVKGLVEARIEAVLQRVSQNAMSRRQALRDRDRPPVLLDPSLDPALNPDSPDHDPQSSEDRIPLEGGSEAPENPPGLHSPSNSPPSTSAHTATPCPPPPADAARGEEISVQ